MGCDSILNIDLEYFASSNDTIQYQGCAFDEYSIEVNENTYNIDNPRGTEILKTSNGCDSIIRLELNFMENGCRITFPNMINPLANNPLNSNFYPMSEMNCDIEILKFVIFDRWGNLIFSDNNNSWNGTNDGQLVLPGVYTYYCEIETGCGILREPGTVTVVY